MKTSLATSGATQRARALLTFTLIVAATAGVACAQRRPSAARESNISYDIPQGWRRAEQDGTQLLTPPDLQAGETCVLIVLPGDELRGGDFRAAFDAARGELESGERVVETTEVKAEKNPNGYDTLYSLAVTDDAQGKRTYRLYLAAHPGSRFEMIVYAAGNEETFKRYQPAVLEFVKSIQFANLNPALASSSSSAPPSRSKSSPLSSRGGLEGLYVGTETRQQFNPNTKFYDYVVRQVYYLFLPGGRVYRGLPQGGTLDGFDCERAARETAQGCGTYQVNGDTIQFNFGANGASNPVAFRRSADRLQIGATNYFRVEPADARRLAGVYARRSFTNLSGGAGVSSGGVSGETAIAFDGGGRFESAGFVGFAAGGTGAASSSGRDAGTYRLDGTTLELTHADGRRTLHTAFLMPREDNVLVIDGATYLKREN